MSSLAVPARNDAERLDHPAPDQLGARSVLFAATAEEADQRAVGEATAATKTVLVISYVFPPAAYVGVHRTLKYCKYLGKLGWRPIVVTIDPKDVVLQDQRLCDELPPDIEVFRTRDIDPAKWLASRPSPTAAESQAESSRTARDGVAGAPPSASFSARAKQLVRQALLHSPDSHLFWVPFAFVRGARVLLTRRVDVVYSSSPPHSSHLAASLLAKCFGKPHVADFRDPWFVKGSKRATGASPGVFGGAQAWLKRFVVSNASRVVSVSAGERSDLLAELPALEPSRVEVITNGYDPGDFSECSTPAPDDERRFTITHAGTLYPSVGREFFEALEHLVTTHPELRDRLRVNLLGKTAPEYHGAIERLSRLGVLKDLGFQPHRTALAVARNSDLLLILLGGQFFLSSHIPAKIFEYLFIGKPILAVAPPGDATEIVQRSGLGVSVPPGDARGLATAILDLHSGLQSRQLQFRPNWDYIRRFERRRLTETLAGVLEHATANHRRRSSRLTSLGVH